MPRPLSDEGPILRATIDILATDGVEGLAVDRVAAVAGVSKATIYRRWKSRAQLIHAAIMSLQRPLAEPDTGSVSEDLKCLLRQLVLYVSQRETGRLFASFIDATTCDPELESLRNQMVRAARLSYERVVQRGIARGELPADVDVDLLIELIMAPVIYRSHVERKTVRGKYADTVVDTILAAFTAAPAAHAG